MLLTIVMIRVHDYVTGGLMDKGNKAGWCKAILALTGGVSPKLGGVCVTSACCDTISVCVCLCVCR